MDRFNAIIYIKKDPGVHQTQEQSRMCWDTSDDIRNYL